MRESPESLIVPPASPSSSSSSAGSIDIHQRKKVAEASLYSIIDLEMCDNCGWSCTCLDTRRISEFCVLCGTKLSHIPVGEDEAYRIKVDKEQGQIVEFTRRMLLN